MAVTVISGIPKPKPTKPTKPTKKKIVRPQLQVHLSDEDTRRLDECVKAAQTNRPALIRRLIFLAHRDLLLWRAFTDRGIAEPGNGREAEVSEEPK